MNRRMYGRMDGWILIYMLPAFTNTWHTECSGAGRGGHGSGGVAGPNNSVTRHGFVCPELSNFTARNAANCVHECIKTTKLLITLSQCMTLSAGNVIPSRK